MTKPRQTITVLPVEQLTAHPGNIREDLGDLSEMAVSIREHGILQPLTVTEHPTRDGVFVLLAGHRRLSAALVPWFGPAHRLADVVRRSCSHKTRSQVYGVGCGPCWETALVGEDQAARDQAARDQAARDQAARDQAARDVDDVVIQRVINGDWSAARNATREERHAIVDRWVQLGWSLADLERNTGWKPKRYGTRQQVAS